MADMNTLMQAAAVSATTSALVALGVEWAAKPRLEARKDAILARRRSETELRRQLLRIREAAIRLNTFDVEGTVFKYRSVIRRESKTTTDRLVDAVQVLDLVVTDLAPDLLPDAYELYAAYLGYLIAAIEIDEPWESKSRSLLLATGVVIRANDARAFPKWRRRKKFKEAYALIHAEDFSALADSVFTDKSDVGA